jgi:AraC family transcriptional regulator of adaptative response/methylated-DNA-[protein]-cysteine methyltransferase
MPTEDYERVEKAIRYLEANFRSQPDLKEIARNTGLSEYHFHRLFTRWAGISPKRFLQFLTASFARQLLRESAGMLTAAFESGLSGPGRLHDLIVGVYAVTPGELRDEGEGVTIRYGVHPGPFGRFFLAVTGKGICALSFLPGPDAGQAEEDLRKSWRNAKLAEDPKGTKAVADRIFGPPRRDGAPALNVIVKGTNFQVKVWEALVRIPPGFVASYEDIASRVGAPRAMRAVGSALAANPVAFLVPCHRVIRKTGAFGNYGGGTARKMAMLAWEAARRERG